MLIYIFLLFLTVLCCIYSGNSKLKNTYCAFILLMIFAFLCGLRGINCGTDNINYLGIFNTQHHQAEYEYGFIWSYKLIKNFNFWLFLYSFFTYTILFFQLKKECRFICLGVLLYLVSTTRFFPESFNIIRQSLAASLLLWSFIAWNKNEKTQAFVALILATLFHTSTLIALPFYLLKYVKISYSISVMGLCITAILGMSHLINEVLQIFVLGMSVYDGSDATMDMVNKYASYGNDTSYSTAKAMLTNTIPITIMALLTYPKSSIRYEKYGFYYNVFAITTMIGNIFIPSMVYGFRLVFSLQIVQILVFPLAYQYSNKIRRQYLVALIVLISLIFIYYLYLIPNAGVRTIVPYKMIDDFQIVLDSFGL